MGIEDEKKVKMSNEWCLDVINRKWGIECIWMKNGNGKWIGYELDWSKEEKVIIRLNSYINYI